MKHYYYLVITEYLIIEMIKRYKITHYNKSLESRLKISKDNGFCCIINGTHIYQANNFN